MGMNALVAVHVVWENVIVIQELMEIDVKKAAAQWSAQKIVECV